MLAGVEFTGNAVVKRTTGIDLVGMIEEFTGKVEDEDDATGSEDTPGEIVDNK